MTRVVRLLAEGTIEESIVAMQQRKLAALGSPSNATELPVQDVDASMLVRLINDHPKTDEAKT